MNDTVFNRLSAIAKRFNIKLSKIELMESKLEDGTIIQYETLEVGSLINVISTDGSLTPITDGTYVIEDSNGKKFTVITMNGKIDSIVEYVEEETTTEEETTEEETTEEVTEAPAETEEVAETTEEVTETNYEERLSHLEEVLNNLVSILESMGVELTNANNKNKELELKLESIAKSPAKEVIIDNSNITPKLAQRIQQHAMIQKLHK